MEIEQINQSWGTKLYNLLNTISDNQYVQCPCRVTAVNGNYVDVLPIINDDMKNQELYDVKIRHLESSTAYIYLGVHVGDKGVLRFFDRSIDDYSANGSEGYNQDDRFHNVNDGCFELGFIPDNEAYVYPNQTVALNVDQILSDFNSDDFNTNLTTEEEQQYQLWFANMQTQGYIVEGDNGYDYDFRGAFKAGFSPSEVGGHWVDTWKKPNHSTFSNESIYATGQYAKYAGSWDGDTYKMPQSRIMPDPEIEIGLKNGFCKISFQADGTLNINSTVATIITAPIVTINGNVVVNGTITAIGEVTGADILLSQHTHTGNLGSPTSPPNP